MFAIALLLESASIERTFRKNLCSFCIKKSAYVIFSIFVSTLSDGFILRGKVHISHLPFSQSIGFFNSYSLFSLKDNSVFLNFSLNHLIKQSEANFNSIENISAIAFGLFPSLTFMAASLNCFIVISSLYFNCSDVK